MKVETKECLLRWAEAIDSLRIVPRIFFGSLSAVSLWLIVRLVDGFLNIRPPDINASYVGAITAFLGTLGTLIGYSYRVYTENGRNWDHPPPGAT